MNQLLSPQQQQTFLKKFRWRQRRLQQFADRSELSLTQVTVLMEDRARAPSLEMEIDRTVDPEYQNANKPL